MFVSSPERGEIMDGKRLSRLLSWRAVVGCAAVAAMVMSAACSSAKTGSSSSGSTKGLTIGVSLSLTGDFADPGKAVQRGYQLWADQVNAKGGLLGRKITL